LFAVFDSYDEALHPIYRALFNRNEEIRSSLGVDPSVHEVLLVRSLQLKPRWRGTGLGAQAIQTAASTLVTMGLVVANADLSPLPRRLAEPRVRQHRSLQGVLRLRADQQEPLRPRGSRGVSSGQPLTSSRRRSSRTDGKPLFGPLLLAAPVSLGAAQITPRPRHNPHNQHRILRDAGKTAKLGRGNAKSPRLSRSANRGTAHIPPDRKSLTRLPMLSESL